MDKSSASDIAESNAALAGEDFERVYAPAEA